MRLKVSHPRRVLAVAWTLEWLFRDGFAYPSNSHLVAESGLTRDQVERALKQLADAKVIIRIQVEGARRIYPAIPATSTGGDARQPARHVDGSTTRRCGTPETRHVDRKSPAALAGRNTKNTQDRPPTAATSEEKDRDKCPF
jgi:DNA-binding transcriptional MocR family regulator